MSQAHPNCRATGLGSTPHTSAATAVDFVLETFPDVPFWPQLPRRVFLENMYVQFTEHLPGVRIEGEREGISIDLEGDWLEQAESFYAAFLEGDPSRFAISPTHAAGLHEFLQRRSLAPEPAVAEMAPANSQSQVSGPRPWAVKGQVTGPISFGLQVTDQKLRPSLYDDDMRDVIVKHVLRQAQWQEAQLRALSPRTIISVDEPFLSMVGSAYASLSREGVVAMLEEVHGGLQGWTCSHCCANTDWGILLGTSVDVLACDAYAYAENLALYPEELGAFLSRGGMLAWGLVPNTAGAAEVITVDGAWDVLERALLCFERKGFDRRQLLPRSFITPACGTGSLSVSVAEHVMQVASELSTQVRESYEMG